HTEESRKHLHDNTNNNSPYHIDANLKSHNADHVLVAVSDNKAAVLNSEGVGTKETDGTVGVFIETGLQVDRVDIPVDRIVAAMTCETVDLADAIRVFGARLDSNHHQWFTAYTGTYQP